MRSTIRFKACRLAATAASVLCTFLYAQAVSAQTFPESPSPAALTGEVGIAGEAYLASGIGNRRDPASALVFGRASSQGSSLRYGFQFLLDTEQTGIRQSTNRYSANLGYQFLRVTAGDYSPILSRFSVNGTTIRGGAVEVTPGPVIATLMVGRLRRSVEVVDGFTLARPSHREWVYSMRVGAGPSTGSHVHLIGVVGRDSEGSLPDSLNVSPRENVSLTPDLGLVLLDNRLELRATYTLSAFSADTRAGETDSGVSTMMGLFTPRAGSRVDYATEVSGKFHTRDFRIHTSYERIQPGFQSLGLIQTRSDRATFRVEPGFVLANRRVNLNLRFSSSHNNLEGNRVATLRRRNASLHGHFRLSPVTSLLAVYSNLRSKNDLDGVVTTVPVSNQKNTAQTFVIGPTFTMTSGPNTHVVSINGSYQLLRDQSPGSESSSAAEFDNLTATAAYNIGFASGYSLNASAGYLSSTTPAADAGALGLTLGAGASLLQRRGKISLTAGWSRNSLDLKGSTAEAFNSSQLSLRLAGSYRVPTGSTIRLTIRGLKNSGDLTPSFREMQASLRFEHRF